MSPTCQKGYQTTPTFQGLKKEGEPTIATPGGGKVRAHLSPSLYSYERPNRKCFIDEAVTRVDERGLDANIFTKGGCTQCGKIVSVQVVEAP